MSAREFKVGDRVRTLVSMTDPATHHLAGRRGTVKEIHDRRVLPILVNLDGFPSGVTFRCNPIPFDAYELGVEDT